MSKNRKDGKYIKPEDSIHAIMPYLFKNRTEAEEKLSKLNSILVAAGRMDELVKSFTDKALRNKLMNEYSAQLSWHYKEKIQDNRGRCEWDVWSYRKK